MTTGTPRTNDLFGITDEYMPSDEEVELKLCRQLEYEMRKTQKDAERYQKLRCWHQRVEVRYWTGECWIPLISDKLDAMLDGISDYRSV